MAFRYPYRHLTTPLDLDNWEALNDNFTDIELDLKNFSQNVLDEVIDNAMLIWQAPVANFAALATAYPNPQNGFAVQTLDDGRVYRFDGVNWMYILTESSSAALSAEIETARGPFGNLEARMIAQEYYVTPERFGATGNGTTDDRTALVNAIGFAIANNRPLALRGGRRYRVSSQILITGNLEIVGLGNRKAVIFSDSQTFVPLRVQGQLKGSTTVSQNITVNDNHVTVANGANINAGDLILVKSSRSWFYDPRPESTDARVSQLHLVDGREGNVLFLRDGFHEGYDLASESVTVDVVSPIQFDIRNVEVELTKAVLNSTQNQIGIILDYVKDSSIREFAVTNAQAAGVSVRHSYNVKVSDGTVHGSNYYFSGYGAQSVGSSFAIFDRIEVSNARRGVDISGFQIVSSFCTVRNCSMTGSGRNSYGEVYGWNPDGSLGAAVYGFGTHGPATHTVFEGNQVTNVHSALLTRGKNTVIRDNDIYGSIKEAVIDLAFGENIVVEDNTYNPNTTAQGINFSAAARAKQAEVFFRVQNSAAINRNSRSFIEVTGNTAKGLNKAFFLFTGGSSSPVIPTQGNVVIEDNNMMFIQDSAAVPVAVVMTDNPANTGGTPVVLGPGCSVMNNRFRRFTGGSAYLYSSVQVRNGGSSFSPVTHSFSMANNTVQSINLGNKEVNAVRLMVDTNEGHALIKVKELSTVSQVVGTTNKILTTNTFPLLATTGQDDALTLSLSDGVLMINNRLGQTEQVQITVLNLM